MNSQLKAVFFDIGGTLGTVNPDNFELKLYSDSKVMLDLFKRVLGLKLGIISNTPDSFTQAQFLAMLDGAGIRQFFDSQCLMASSVVGVDKSNPEIFRKASIKAAVKVEACLFIGESAQEVSIATQAGMAGLLKPLI